MITGILRALVPGACLLCDAAITTEPFDLCTYCRASLPLIADPCPRCALPLPAGAGAICGACLAAPPPWTIAVAPYRYEGPIADWIRRLKDHLGMVEGRTLGYLLADAAAAACTRSRTPDLLIPVPLTIARTMLRGHNQAVALAAPVARRLGVPLERRAARRVRGSTPQRGLGRAARRANLAGVFGARRDFTGLCVGIVDDVLTTGTTAAELTLTLLAAGATEVSVICAARTIPRRSR
jgi:ComF family protein